MSSNPTTEKMSSNPTTEKKQTNIQLAFFFLSENKISKDFFSDINQKHCFNFLFFGNSFRRINLNLFLFAVYYDIYALMEQKCYLEMPITFY